MSIKVSQLTKIYGTQKAVNAVSFTVNKGEIVGFLGPNGAGKSTTMKIITGFLEPDEGSVAVCGISTHSNGVETRRKIGYLPESNPLYFDMYVREYLEFIAGVYGVKGIRSKVDEVVAVTGLIPEAGKKIGQLSKGYKQRAGLAAALIHDPEVLILDEPTSGLDPNQIVEIRELIRNLGKNKTVLFSSHILSEVEAMCERVIIINKGNIVADNKLEELTKGKHQDELRIQLKETADRDVFESLPQAVQLNATTWSFKTGNPDQLKRKIMEIALDKNLTIVSWETGSAGGLEEVFRELTR